VTVLSKRPWTPTRVEPLYIQGSVYTEVVLDKIEGFDWDTTNIDHIMRHVVTPFEVEEEAVWQDGVRAVPGSGVHDPAEAVPNRDCL